MSLFQIIYVSRRTTGERLARLNDWQEITRLAAIRNPLRDITGCLLGGHSHFVQVLEGEASIVEDLFARIGRDPRHGALACIGRRSIRNRSFAGWGNICLQDTPLAGETLMRHGLTPDLQPAELSMPSALALAMELADAVRVPELAPCALAALPALAATAADGSPRP